MVTIRILRSIKGISQRELARRLGVPVASWHRMETGARLISSALLPQLAEALSLTTEELAAALPVVDVGTHDQD